KDAIEYVKSLLSYLPSNNLSEAPAFPEEADLTTTAAAPPATAAPPDAADGHRHPRRATARPRLQARSSAPPARDGTVLTAPPRVPAPPRTHVRRDPP
ncbi:hypothetical protein, partial [Streptomyces californicus]|uniref:hypothetical protein n=1 Tax=Streptomyces californicus TaxID=67351 RepID=UPI0033EF32A0